MLDLRPDSDGEIGSVALNSSQSSSSSSSMTSSCDRCSSFSPRPSSSSFDAAATDPAAAAPLPPLLPPSLAESETNSSSGGNHCSDDDSRRSRLIDLPSRKPHRSSDPAWAAIRNVQNGGIGGGCVGPRDFKLVRRIGSGDIGTVYLCHLRNDDRPDQERSAPPCLYAMKVVDKRELAKKKKLGRAEAERRVLGALDHPFLPTLYADFDAPPYFSCAVMEFCCGGDLHSLRHRQPAKRFPLPAVRFYGAEVLLALEYLHMLGIVYRDLKPENVLIRSDGHIMLSDFDLSLESTASPSIHSLDCPTPPSLYSDGDDDDDDGRHSPTCLPNRLFRFGKPKKENRRADRLPRSRSTSSSSSSANRLFVAEPLEARSSSFVGTHEYVAPEVASGRAHGSAVDWWAYGVFLYELACGRTPFAGPTNESTLRNIVKTPLSFPPPAHHQCGPSDPRLRDLISRLLAKDPAQRLGSRRGAAEVKAHPFFEGLNFALLRSQRPPVVPGLAVRSVSCRERPQKLDRSLDYYF